MKKIIPLLVLTAASSAPPGADLAAPTPLLVPERFFAGRTESQGTLKVMMMATKTVKVRSNGHVEGDTLVLDQLVEQEGEPAERRQWRIKKLASGRYSGTISDAKGPVSGDISGNRLHMRFKLNKAGGINVEQWMYLQPGGRVAINHATLQRFGMKVGSLEETVRRID